MSTLLLLLVLALLCSYVLLLPLFLPLYGTVYWHCHCYVQYYHSCYLLSLSRTSFSCIFFHTSFLPFVGRSVPPCSNSLHHPPSYLSHLPFYSKEAHLPTYSLRVYGMCVLATSALQLILGQHYLRIIEHNATYYLKIIYG